MLVSIKKDLNEPVRSGIKYSLSTFQIPQPSVDTSTEQLLVSSRTKTMLKIAAQLLEICPH